MEAAENANSAQYRAILARATFRRGSRAPGSQIFPRSSASTLLPHARARFPVFFLFLPSVTDKLELLPRVTEQLRQW